MGHWLFLEDWKCVPSFGSSYPYLYILCAVFVTSTSSQAFHCFHFEQQPSAWLPSLEMDPNLLLSPF